MNDSNRQILAIIEAGLAYLVENGIDPVYIELSDQQLKRIRTEWKGDLIYLFQSGTNEYGILGYPLRVVLGKFLSPVYIVGKIGRFRARYGFTFNDALQVVSKEMVFSIKSKITV